MNRRVLVEPLAVDSVSRTDYAAFVASVGFEERSTYIALKFNIQATKRYAFGFTHNKKLSYEKSLLWYGQSKFIVQEPPDAAYVDLIRELVCGLANQNEKDVRIAVDISSMTRERLAAVVSAAASCGGASRVIVDFLYALADFSPPPEHQLPVRPAKPVIPAFAGYPEDPSIPSSCVVGIGYEPGKALGALEELEPGEIWIFVPVGGDVQFERAVRKANDILLTSSLPERVLGYNVTRPLEAFLTLESLTAALMQVSRPVLLPLGPKIFSLCTLLVAARHAPRVSVWRVSAGAEEEPAQRIPSGHTTGIRAEFRRTET